MIELTTVEIVVALGGLILGPFGSAWVGTRQGLNGVKKDVSDVKKTVDNIQSVQSQQQLKSAMLEQRVDMIVNHCEFVHEQPISEHISRKPRNP